MYTLKRLNILLVVLGLSFGAPAFAAPATDASIDKLIQLSELDVVFQQSIKELQPFFDQQAEELVTTLVNTANLDAKQLAVAQQLSQAMSNMTIIALKDPSVTQKLKQTLKNTYTEKEAQAYNAFLSTPEGQSINRKSASVTIEIQKFIEETIIKATEANDFDKEVEKIIAPLIER